MSDPIDPPMEPHPASTWWLSSGTGPIESDPHMATLIVRLELALNFLVVQMRSGVRTEAEAATAVSTRALMLSFVATAAYTKEALTILTGSGGVAGEFARVAALAQKAAPQKLKKKIGRLCGGTDPASPVLENLRNKLAFHWDPRALEPSLLEYVSNGTVVWMEASGPTSADAVHRLAIEVLLNAILPKDPSPPATPEERALRYRQRLTSAMRSVGDAARAVVEYFNHAVTEYFHTIGVQGQRREPRPEPDQSDSGSPGKG